MANTQHISSQEWDERRSNFQRIVEKENLSNIDLKQKAYIKWKLDGDENTRVFHGYINNKKMKNCIMTW